MARIRLFAVLLLGLCLTRLTFADAPRPALSETSQRVRPTIERATAYLQTEGTSWLKTRRCAACHHVAITVWALSEADRRGYAIDRRFLAETAEAALGSRQKMIASGLLANPAGPPDPRPMARGVNPGQVFMAVAAESLPSLDDGQKESLRFIADDIVKKQREDGSWEFFLSRPPINENQTSDAAWIIMALMGEQGPDVPQSHRAAITKSIAWLSHTDASETYQDKVLKTLIAIRTKQHEDQIKAAIDGLLALEQPDGGWSQLPQTSSDAFATGQTLYVLALAGCKPDRLEMQRAIDFLVSTQRPDGSWPMRSRATPDGRPGSAKLLTPITTAAGAWAVLGLARAAPNESHE